MRILIILLIDVSCTTLLYLVTVQCATSAHQHALAFTYNTIMEDYEACFILLNITMLSYHNVMQIIASNNTNWFGDMA